MIQVRFPSNRYFETAFFVLRPARPGDMPAQRDMIREAQRILRESELLKKSGGRKRALDGRSLPFFLIGGLCGGALIGLIWLAFALF